MENPIIGTSGESECTDIDGHESSCGSTQGEDELEGALSRVNELLDEATKEMDDGVLANVIVVLRKSSPEEECDEARAKVEVALIKALVTRFARHGLVEDLDEGVELLLRETLTPFAFTDQSPISGSEDEDCTDKVSSALDSLRKYRRSIDMSKVETAIVVAKQALSSYRGATNVRGELLLRTGNALVLKYLASDDERHLDLAASSFQDARRLFRSGDHDPMLFITLLNLQHIACIKFIEHERQELVELKRLREEMEAEDEQGRSAHMMGSQLMEDGNLHVEEAILWFQHSLSFRPPRHPRRLRTLDHYAIALVNRFGSMSDSRDLEEAVTLQREVLSSRSPGHPDRLGSLNNLASSLSTRFHHEGDLRDLEECVTLDREALALCPPGHPGHSSSLHNLATSLLSLFRHRGDFRDLEESVSLHREALSLRPPGHPERPRSLSNLAASLGTRFHHKGDFRDLKECAMLYREGLDLRSPGHPDRPRYLHNLATSLLTLFQHKGDLHDLEECVILYRETLALCPPGHPERSRSLSNLAASLGTRFQHKGDFFDLEECIELRSETLTLRPLDHPDFPRSLNDLAAALTTRFQHRGDFRDLEEAVALHRKALALRPPGHPDRHRFLNDMAASLATQFQHKGDFRDLEESVSLHREALLLRPPGHTDRLASLNNLASSLATRFHHKGDVRDLEECITLDREALALCPPGHPDHSGSLNNLATSLLTVFLHKGDVRDLEECVALNREALALRPPGHPDRHRTLNDLATSVLTRFQHKGDFRDLEECITLNREALGLRSPGHPDRPRSLNILAFSLVTRFRHEGNFCDLEEGITLEREALVLRPPGHSDRASYLHNLATSLLTLFQHKGDFHDLEDSVSLHREALSLRPPGHPERPRSLNDFAITLSACFEHKGDFCDLEACIEALREARLLYSELDTSLGAEPNSRDTLADHPYWLSVTGNLVNNLKIKYRATGDDDVLDEIFRLLRSGSQSHGTLPLRRLDHARLWSSTCREFDRLEMALEAYGYGVATLPHLASLDLTLEQRQNALVWAKDLSRDAVRCAIEQGQLETAVVFLSTARSVFWSQAFQFRGPLDRLDALHPDLASELRSVTRQLEVATHETPQSGSASVQGLSQRPYLLAQKREAIISQIRAIDGFHDFLLPPSFDTLRTAARDNPIVFLNASKYGCDALILKQDGTLHCHSLSTDLEQIAGFADAIHQLSRGQTVGTQLQRKIDDFCQSRNTRLQLRRRTQRTAEDDFKQLLEILWDVVAEPVIRILGLQKTDEPQRVWWCPTGPFAFLPIHAAGIYSDNAEASDCLSDYVVSSYCSSPQDLIAPPPTPNDEYEVLVVVEPGESGPSIHSLPFTLEELKMIQGLVPHERHLVTRVGSAETPSDPDAILGHINTASIVHFGCHGSQDDSNPLDSSLILSGGRLTMGSLIRGCRTSKAALAYLSACETAMGDKERPDESLSLAGTMQFAGFRSVVATMWSIHDEDAPVVADAFYRHLFRRGTAAPPDITDAAYGLHLAVKKLRDLGRPFYRWVPFVHHGI